MAQKTGCAILLIGHLNKATGAQSNYRGLGSIDFTACVRSLLLLGRKKKDPEIRVLTHDKSSLAAPGPSLAFTLNEDTGFCWIGEIDVTADELMSGVDESKDESKKSMAMALIRRMLGTGPVLYETILQEAFKEEISQRTLYNAKQSLEQKGEIRWRMVGRKKQYYLTADSGKNRKDSGNMPRDVASCRFATVEEDEKKENHYD